MHGNNPGSCHIHATLADGSTWVAVLSWAFGSTGPCRPEVTYNVGPPPVFTREKTREWMQLEISQLAEASGTRRALT